MKKREKVFEGRLLGIFKGKKKLPGGREVYIEEVDHPGAVLIVPFAGERIVLLRQFRPVIGKYIWELPAGTLEEGETPYACARRELREETGYAAKGIRRAGVIYTSPGFCNERIYIFAAECTGREKKGAGGDELIRVKLFTRREIRGLFRNGRINDSKTVAALTFTGIL